MSARRLSSIAPGQFVSCTPWDVKNMVMSRLSWPDVRFSRPGHASRAASRLFTGHIHRLPVQKCGDAQLMSEMLKEV